MAEYDPHEFDRREEDPSPYEVYLMERKATHALERQIQRHGDEAMRVGMQAPLGSMPTESYVRSYQMKMGDARVKKVDKPDPCRRLLKAMKIQMMDQNGTRRHAYDDS